MTVREVGECHVCECACKVHSGGVALHGYRRPGYGHVEGRCPGAGHPPYELSCDLLKDYLPTVRAHVLALAASVVKLDAGEVTYFEVTHLEGRGRFAQVVTETYSATVNDPIAWGYAPRHHRMLVYGDLHRVEADVARLEHRIAAWALRPLRTVDEHGLTEDGRAAKAARAQERAAKVAARKAKGDALKAALEAKEAAKRARLTEVAAQLAELAKAPGAAATAAAWAILDALDKPAARRVVGRDWQDALEDMAGDAMVALGLAERHAGNGRAWIRR